MSYEVMPPRQGGRVKSKAIAEALPAYPDPVAETERTRMLQHEPDVLPDVKSPRGSVHVDPEGHLKSAYMPISRE